MNTGAGYHMGTKRHLKCRRDEQEGPQEKTGLVRATQERVTATWQVRHCGGHVTTAQGRRAGMSRAVMNIRLHLWLRGFLALPSQASLASHKERASPGLSTAQIQLCPSTPILDRVSAGFRIRTRQPGVLGGQHAAAALNNIFIPKTNTVSSIKGLDFKLFPTRACCFSCSTGMQ